MTIQDIIIFNISDYIIRDNILIGMTLEIYSKDFDIKDYVEITRKEIGLNFSGNISATLINKLASKGFSIIDLRNAAIAYYKEVQ